MQTIAIGTLVVLRQRNSKDIKPCIGVVIDINYHRAKVFPYLIFFPNINTNGWWDGWDSLDWHIRNDLEEVL